MDNLFEQAAMISKAHGYDVLVPHVNELKEAIRDIFKGSFGFTFFSYDSCPYFMHIFLSCKLFYWNYFKADIVFQ
jgi:hypothetical protein